jgi:hypothetical protein
MSLKMAGARSAPRALAALVSVTLIAMTLALAFDVEVGLAADYQDKKHNVCEGTFSSGSCAWGSHVTGESNLALGDAMMPVLTGGSGNIALDFGALAADTEGNGNVATGTIALHSNTTGSNNIASGGAALFSNTSGSDNIATGINALLSNTKGNGNVAVGNEALLFNTTGSNNEASGFQALKDNTTGNHNIAIGFQALLSETEGSGNVASGSLALEHDTTGNSNTANGTGALLANTTGSFNVAVGTSAGKNLTTGSHNLDIANGGVAAEEDTTRIGTDGTQTRAFMAGVYKKPIAPPACAVKVDSEGQLGCNPGENSTALATFASRKAVASGNCLAYTDIGPAGTGACPAKATGFSSSTTLAPTPANGATVTNLYTDSNATVTGTDAVLVAVIDNTTGATLLSCTVTSSTPHGCSNSSESGSAAAGDNIEVKLTATGTSGTGKMWRVTFRF